MVITTVMNDTEQQTIPIPPHGVNASGAQPVRPTGAALWFSQAAVACRARAKAWPVIARELRAESRRSSNYWLRVFGATVVIIVFTTFMLTSDLDQTGLGAAMFRTLETTLYFVFLAVVPLMTADCVSQEKREGTLGLLFLTPLRVVDVILAKSAAQAVRALTLLLAALPVLVLPFVVGGVSAYAAERAVLQVGTVVLTGIAAGIYASCRGGSTIQVMVMAEGCGLLLAGLAALGTTLLSIPMRLLFWPSLSASFRMLGWAIASSLWPIGLFGLVLRASTLRLQQTWHEDAAAPEQPRWVKLFSTSDFWQAVFRWNKGRTLDRNPMAWLQEYSWTARLTKWGWFLLVVAAELAVSPDWDSIRVADAQCIFAAVLGLGVAFSAVGSFRRERQTGLLEVLLVTPLSAAQLLRGRLWGIFCHYFPSLAVLMAWWAAIQLMERQGYQPSLLISIFPSPLAFVAVSVLGLYLSLRKLNFFVAWLASWVGAMLLPALALAAIGSNTPISSITAGVISSAMQFGLAVMVWPLLESDMRLRTFLSTEKK
jgi:hypothetical protein